MNESQSGHQSASHGLGAPFTYRTPGEPLTGRNGVVTRVLLLADDDESVQAIAEVLGRDSRFALRREDRIVTALPALREGAFDLVLLDLKVSNAPGLVGLRRVLAAAGEIPVIVLSTWDDDALTHAALQAGAADYVVREELADEPLARTMSYALDRKKVENALRRSEVKHRTLVEQLPAIVYRRALDGSRLTYVSPQLEAMLGFDPEEWIADPSLLVKRLHPDDRETVRQTLAACAEGRPFRATYRVRRRDGETVWISDEAIVLRDGEGSVPIMQGVMVDITERVEAKERVAERDRWFGTLLEHGLDLIAVVDAAAGIQFISPSVQSLLGHRPEDLTGMSAFTFVHPDDLDQARAALARLLAEAAGTETVEIRFHHLDGSWRWHEVTARALPGGAGAHGIVINSRDVTERKRTARELELLGTAIRQSSEMIVITDVEGTIRYVNPAFQRITGYAPDEAVGQNPRILKSGMHDELFYQRMWTRLRAGRPFTGRLVNRRKDGTLYHQETVVYGVRETGGDIKNFVAVGRDVSREILLEAELRQAQKMEAVGTLTGGIAHDFNNLLSVISANAETLSELLEHETEEVTEAVRDVRAAARNGASMVRRLLGFSRKADLLPKPTMLAGVVQSVSEMLKRVIPETIHVSIDVDGSSRPASVDEGAIEQVLLNLATNARDAMPSGGELTITAVDEVVDKAAARERSWFAPGTYVRLSVRDTGQGMNDETKRRIFEPFFTTKGEGSGTGLGMAMVYGLMKQHGGFVDIQSALGEGTTVNLWFPALAEDVVPHAIEAEAVRTVRATGVETVLYVEDEEALRRTGARILERHGFRVIVAEDGQQALELFRLHPDVDVVVSDLVMPRLGGRDLLDALRIEDPSLPFALTTGYAAGELASFDELGSSVVVIPKPWSIDQLLSGIRQALEARNVPAGES